MTEVTSSIFRRRAPKAASLGHSSAVRSGVSIICHENSVPLSIGPELAKLYHNIFSSLEHFQAYGGLTTDTCTYIAREGQEIVAIFLFRRAADVVLVLNEGMTVNDTIIEDFASYVFSSWPAVNLIVFQAVHARMERLPYPFQSLECTAYLTMPLPPSAEEYLTGLGRNMRRNIRRYLKRISSDFPSFRFDTYIGQEIDPAHVHAILDFSRARITSLDRNFAIEEEIPSIVELARTTGVIGVVSIDGKICGGVIGFRTGDTYFAKVLGHDAAYRDYSLGILCCYLMICECIARGCREFNFMWNEYPYKVALGGVRERLDRVVVYRSPVQLFLKGDFALKVLVSSWRYRLSCLLEKEGSFDELSPVLKLMARALFWMRRRQQPRGSKTGKQQKPDAEDTELGI